MSGISEETGGWERKPKEEEEEKEEVPQIVDNAIVNMGHEHDLDFLQLCTKFFDHEFEFYGGTCRLHLQN